jgi:outer membrane lipoprotein-sorting protein
MRCTVLLFVVSVLTSLTPAQTTQPELWKRLQELDAQTATIKDLTADFEQQKFTPLLKKPMVSTGTIKVRGSAMRWDTLKPSPTVMRVDEKSVQLYYPQQKTMEVFPVEGQLGSLAASPLPRLEVLKQYFSFHSFETKRAGLPENATLVRLEPINPEIAQHVKEVNVILDGRGLVWEFEMTDADGERTVINFRNLRTDTGLSEADADLKPPAGTKIVKPLDNVGASPGK